MNTTIDNMISRNVRRASGLALVLMMACNPAMAAGKPASGGSTDEPWLLSYACDGANLDLVVVAGAIPAGKRLDVAFVSGTFFYQSYGEAPDLVVIEGFDDSSLPMLLTGTPYSDGYIQVLEKTVAISFTQQPSSVHFSLVLDTLSNSTYCNLQFHGVLRDQ